MPVVEEAALAGPRGWLRRARWPVPPLVEEGALLVEEDALAGPAAG
jgi:hypothetical protein